MVISFIESHKDRFGVAPICTVLTAHGVSIAPSTYYAARRRPPSARAVRDEQVLVQVDSAHYTSIRYTDRLIEAGLEASIGTVADCYDNVLTETVNGLYKAELVYWEGPWTGADELELATLGWVDWFNHTRLHSSLDYRTPAEVEAEYYRHNHPDRQPLAGELTV